MVLKLGPLLLIRGLSLTLEGWFFYICSGRSPQIRAIKLFLIDIDTRDPLVNPSAPSSSSLFPCVCTCHGGSRRSGADSLDARPRWDLYPHGLVGIRSRMGLLGEPLATGSSRAGAHHDLARIHSHRGLLGEPLLGLWGRSPLPHGLIKRRGIVRAGEWELMAEERSHLWVRNDFNHQVGP